MTNPSTPPPSATSPTSTGSSVPAGIRIASTLCWVVGILTILVAIAIGIPAISGGAGLLFIAINAGAGVIVCIAAVQIRRQRKIGVLLMLIAWAIPTVVALVQHLSPSGSLLLLVALLLSLANWKNFR